MLRWNNTVIPGAWWAPRARTNSKKNHVTKKMSSSTVRSRLIPRGAVESLTISDWSVGGSNPVKTFFYVVVFFFSFFSFSFLTFVWRVFFFYSSHSSWQHAAGKQLSIELFVEYSHFSLVRTIWGKEKILYYRELLVSEKFFKTRWIPLVLPSPVIFGKNFFSIENYLSVRNFCITLGFPCGFTVSAESLVYFWRKV